MKAWLRTWLLHRLGVYEGQLRIRVPRFESGTILVTYRSGQDANLLMLGAKADFPDCSITLTLDEATPAAIRHDLTGNPNRIRVS